MVVVCYVGYILTWPCERDNEVDDREPAFKKDYLDLIEHYQQIGLGVQESDRAMYHAWHL